MAVTLGSALLLGASVLVGLCAVFWPQLETIYLSSQPHGISRGSASSKCPLGYEGTMPSDHPPISPAAGAAGAAGAAVRSGAAAAAAVGREQIVFVNGNIWTADPQIRWASSMSVDAKTGDIILMGRQPASCTAAPATTGTCSSSSSSSSGAGPDVQASVGKGSTVVDLQGAFVMPGFVDPHLHLIYGGMSLLAINLRGAASRQEVAAAVAAAAAAAPEGAWLLGGGWAEAAWGGELPDASWIDEASAGHPTFLTRMDTHMALVNTKALQLAGLLPDDDSSSSSSSSSSSDVDGCGCGNGSGSAAASQPCGGGVDRDPVTGKPTGLLREQAMNLVRDKVPPPSLQQRKAALAAAGSYLLSRGVTSVGDMGWGLFNAAEATWADLEEVYDAAAEAGDLPIRVSSYVPLRTWRRLASRLQAKGQYHPSGRLSWGGVKEFVDGSLGSSTAVMWQPYSDSDGTNTGMRAIELEELEGMVLGAAKAGLQVAVHAIGDRALDELLEIFELVDDCEGPSAPATSANPSAAPPPPPMQHQQQQRQQQQQQQHCIRHRIEHVQHISGPVSAAKLSVLNLFAVPNPQHLLSDRALLLPKLGRVRAGAGHTHAYKTMSDLGVNMGFASDWPVVEVDPFVSVYAAVFRSDPPSTLSSGGSKTSSGSGDSKPQPPPKPPGAVEAWAPEEKLVLEEALVRHTAVAAAAARLDSWVGSLRPGLRADFIVLDRSPFEGLGVAGGEGFGAGMPKVVKTYMDGVCVHGCEGQQEGEGAAGAAAEAAEVTVSAAASTAAAGAEVGSTAAESR